MRYERPEVDATVVAGVEMVQMNTSKTAKTFWEYSKVKIGNKVHCFLACVQQLDMVFDVYQRGSCKWETWEGHGKKDAVRFSIKENTPIYRKFARVLKLENNKTELLNLIADTLSGLFRNQLKVLVKLDNRPYCLIKKFICNACSLVARRKHMKESFCMPGNSPD